MADKNCSSCKHHCVDKQPNKPEYVCWCDWKKDEYNPFGENTCPDWSAND